MKKRYVEQIRVSSEGQNDRDTPEVQRRELDAWRKREPGVLVERIEHVGTGTAGLQDRPDLQRLKVLAEKKAFDELRLYSVSRASRSEDVQDQVLVFGMCQRAGAVIRTSNGTTYDPKDSFAILRWMMEIGAAAADRKQILKNTGMGRARVADEGGKPAGPTPFGLAYDKQRGMWSIHSEHAKVVRRIHEWCGSGVSVLNILRRLNETRAPAPRSKGWARSTVLRVLRSRVYIGEYLYRIGASEALKITVPAIVSVQVWSRTQDALNSRRNRPSRDTYACEALLRQHAVCGVCERGMHVWKQNKKGHVYYRCATIQDGRSCGNRYHRQILLDEEVWTMVADAIRHRKRVHELASKKGKQTQVFDNQITECEQRLANVKKDEAQVFRMLSAGLGEEAGRQRLQELAESRKRVTRALDDLKKKTQNEAARAAAIQEMQDQTKMFASNLDGATFDARRKLLLAVAPDGVILQRDGTFDINSPFVEVA
jgi:DNA invertase Pin-like site-specific DNA recombinase